MNLKKILSVVATFALFVSSASPSYASQVTQSSSIDYESIFTCIPDEYTEIVTVTYHRNSKMYDIHVVDQSTGETILEENNTSLNTLNQWLVVPTVKIIYYAQF